MQAYEERSYKFVETWNRRIYVFQNIEVEPHFPKAGLNSIGFIVRLFEVEES